MTAVTATSQSTRQRHAPIRLLISLLAVVLAASTVLSGNSMLVAAQDGTAPAEATPTQDELQDRRDQAIADGVEQLELEFEEYNDSGIEGTATLYDLGEQTLVAIDIEGGGENHPAHIHEGTCGNAEPEIFAPLTTVDDTGESLSLVDTSLSDLIDGGDYTVDLHLSPDELGTLIACTNIVGTTVPATPARAATATPNATEVPAEEPTPTELPTEEPTEAPVEETPIPTETPTEEARVAPTEEPAETPVPTEVPTEEPTETPAPTEGLTTPVDTSEDGTGGPQAAPDSVASLPLMDYSGLGVTGTISLVAIDETTTKVTIQLTGENVTGGHIAHLHPGTCDTLQDEGTIYLATVGADGVSETTVGISLDDLISDGYSVNVHNSDADYDTWLVCGYLGNATIGMTGDTDITPVPPVEAPPEMDIATTSDGTAGVDGQDDRTTSTLTQSVGVGSGLPWPESPTEAIMWSLGTFAAVLAAAGFLLRRGERSHRQPTRWNRLGI